MTKKAPRLCSGGAKVQPNQGGDKAVSVSRVCQSHGGVVAGAALSNGIFKPGNDGIVPDKKLGIRPRKVCAGASHLTGGTIGHGVGATVGAAAQPVKSDAQISSDAVFLIGTPLGYGLHGLRMDVLTGAQSHHGHALRFLVCIHQGVVIGAGFSMPVALIQPANVCGNQGHARYDQQEAANFSASLLRSS